MEDLTPADVERWLSSEHLDKFFANLNQYYNSLRGIRMDPNTPIPLPPLDMPTTTATRPVSASDEERNQASTLDDYCSYLKIIEQVVSQDRAYNLAIAESLRFNCISTLIGLIMCDIPKKLKISLLDCCASFARSAPSTALALWNKLEILVPALSRNKAPLSGSSWNNGIMTELEDLEPRAQEYSITVCFLRLLRSILEHIAHYQSPHVQQQPALETCINIIINVIMLKVNSRQFNKKEEKWIILNLCVETLYKFISRYDPLTDGTVKKCSFLLMSQILQDGELFKCIIHNVEEVVDETEYVVVNTSTDQQMNGNEQKDETNDARSVETNPLQDKYVLLALQLLNCVFENQSDFMEILREIPGYSTAMNVKLDVLFNGVNYRTGAVDRLSILIRVVALCSSQSSFQALKLLRSVIEEQPSLAQQISLHLSSSKSPLVHGDNLVTIFVNCLASEDKDVRLGALYLISTCLEHKNNSGRASYNLGHELLGFDHHMTTLRQPGSLGKVFDCLHTIIELYEWKSFCQPELKEERTLGLEILHKICTDIRTCDTSLRFLRSSYDFLSKYLNNLYRMIDASAVTKVLDERLAELAWFLRIMSVEIKLTCERNMKSVATNYMNMLLADKPRRLLGLLPVSVCCHTHPVMPNWECFDKNELWKLIAERADSNVIIDLKALHQKLSGEVKQIGLQLGSSQNNLIRIEIEEILLFAADFNQSYQHQRAKSAYFEAWRELCEIIITVNAMKCFDEDLAVRILFELVHELMSRTNLNDFSVNLFTGISSIILLASSVLRSIGAKPTTTTDFVSTANSVQSLLEQPSGLLWGTYKRARVNLYAAFLNASRALPEKLFSDLKFDSNLLERICKDALMGHEISKVLALSILTETDLNWMNDASRDGSLRHLLESLLTDDAELKAASSVTKAFYTFESKIVLFTKIASRHPAGAKQLLHLNLLEKITALQCVRSYLVEQRESHLCRVFTAVVRLMVTLSINIKSCRRDLLPTGHMIFNEIMRNISRLKETSAGLESLLLVTSLLSLLSVKAESRLQHEYVNVIQHFTHRLNPNEVKIVLNVVMGCFRIIKNSPQPALTLFAPSWNSSSLSMMTSQPNLGLLITVMVNVLDDHQQQQHQARQESENEAQRMRIMVIEICIYLVWYHTNIFTNTNLNNGASRELDAFKNESRAVLNDALFNRLATCNSDFVEVFVRRLRTLVRHTAP